MKLTKKQIKQIEELFDMEYKTVQITKKIELKCFIAEEKIGYNEWVCFLTIDKLGVKYYVKNKNHRMYLPNATRMPIDKLIGLAKILEEE